MPDPSGHPLVEAQLRAFAHNLDAHLGDVDLSHAVTERLTRGLPTGPARPRSRRRQLAVALVAALVVSVTAALPAARAALGSLFDLGAVRVHDEAPADPPRGDLRLGGPATLDEVRGRMPVAVPTVAGRSAPDGVWFDDTGGGQVSLVYEAGPGLPATEGTGIGLLVQEFRGDGRPIVDKYLTTDARARAVTIGDEPGVFISGGDHYLYYTDATGAELYEDGRVVGNALIFQRGPLTIRLEGDLSMARMVSLAASLR